MSEKINEVMAFVNECRSLFTYSRDEARHSIYESAISGAIDVHRNHYADVESGTPFLGDCDDIGWTIARGLVERGIVEPEQVRAGFCLSEEGQRQNDAGHKPMKLCDHFAVLVEIDDIEYVVEDCPFAVAVRDSDYDWFITMRLSEEGTWRDARGFFG